MNKMTIYGSPMSRTVRVLWMANELGLDYAHVPVDFRDGGTKAPDYLAINPNGKIPALEDGGFVIWESMAINLYLAKKHVSDLTPKTPEEEALAIQWSVWGIAEIEPSVVEMLQHRVFRPEERRDEVAALRAAEALNRPLGVLEGVLAGRRWLVGDRFTVADLNLSVVLSPAKAVRLDLSPFPHVEAWLTRCTDRPAYAKARGG